MDLTMFHSIYTVVLLVIFLGIVGWAYSGRRAQAFSEAANLPFAEDRQQYSRGDSLNRAKED